MEKVIILASQLIPGQSFKYDEKQRNWRTAHKVLTLPQSCPHPGWTLVIVDDCQQLKFAPTTEVILYPQ